jgi:hypothetical protein
MAHPEIPDDAEGHRRSDSRMLERAYRERWPMGPSVRVQTLRRLARIIDDDAHEGEPAYSRPTNRDVIAAARALLAADKLNLDQQRLDLAAAAAAAGEGDAASAADVIRRAEELAREAAPACPPPSD